MTYTPKSDAELEQLAQDVVAGRVFTDRHCPNLEDLRMVFLALALADKEQIQELRKLDIGMLYEYLDQAGPRSINGMPCFFSFQYLNSEDFAKFAIKYKEIRELLEARKKS